MGPAGFTDRLGNDRLRRQGVLEVRGLPLRARARARSRARRSTPCQAASVRGQSNQVLSAVLRAGRASTAGLSPLSTPDSILMCYRKSRRGVETRRGTEPKWERGKRVAPHTYDWTMLCYVAY
jgi:hypothetical protein